MNILFVGSVIPSELCIKHKGNSVAANKMQLGIIQALSKIPDCNIKVISTYPIAAYPKEKILGMPKRVFTLPTGEKIVSIPFINIFILKQLSHIIGLFLELFLSKKSHDSRNSIIISFNAYTESSFPILLFSRITKYHKICLLADLPFNVIQYGGIKKAAHNLHIKTTLSAIKKFDGLIVLNKEAQKRYAPKLPFCIIDGGINVEEYTEQLDFGEFNANIQKNRVILFTGALIEYNGINTLLEAIKKIKNKDITFKFYGEGPLTQFIINESLTDERIQYKGLVSNNEILKIQKSSTFLINPRPTNEPVSLVTFPSKILEYMMSGTPILTTRLNGLVDDYADYLFFIGDDSTSMARDIEKVLMFDDELLTIRTKLAYKFVKDNKNWDVQVKTIYNFVNTILRKDSKSIGIKSKKD
jgi:glycosyltransferase involved in cell wall biosynthesis